MTAQRFLAPPGRRPVVAGWGIAVPQARMTNEDWAARVDTSDAWIRERTGIVERRVAGAGETTASLAVEAGAAALKSADLTPDAIGACVVATVTPEQPIPFTAAFVQEGLGLACGAFDVDAACSGFVYGMVAAGSLLATSDLGAVLVIGSETLLRITDWDDRRTCVLFGDGAGAVVLTAGRGPGGAGPVADPGILAWDLGCDGTATHILGVRAGGSRLPTSAGTVADGHHVMHMDGQEVFRRAVRALVDSARSTLAAAGVTADDVGLFIPHQANLRIIDAACRRLDLPLERTFVNLDRFGNTSAASIPLALAEAADEGRIAPGDLVLLSGFGAGMSWASILLRWDG